MAKKVDITIVLDRSGSMESIKKDTIGGFNNFLDTQRKLASKKDIDMTLSLVEFNTYSTWIHSNVPIARVPNLTTGSFAPAGGTALLDAIGSTIDSKGAMYRSMKEHDRPDTVIFVVITDGEENSSIIFTRQRIFDMITHQRDKYNWDFVFLGANQDAIKEGHKYGFTFGSTMSYAPTALGTSSAFDSVAVYTSTASLSGANTASFSTSDRNIQTAEGAIPATSGGSKV